MRVERPGPGREGTEGGRRGARQPDPPDAVPARGFYQAGLAAIHEAGFTGTVDAAAGAVLALLGRSGFAGGRVTDLGCGGGRLLERVAAAGFTPAGVDLSPAMVELARRRVPAAELEVGSVYDHRIRPSVAVTAVGEVLSYLAAAPGEHDLERLVGRIHAALEPGGVFVFDVLEARPPEPGLYERETERAGDGWRVRSRTRLAREGTELEREIRWTVGEGPERREVHRCRLLARVDVLELLEGAGFRAEAMSGYGEHVLPGPRVALVARR